MLVYNIIGKRRLKKLLLDYLKQNTDIRRSAIDELNLFLTEVTLEVLKEANRIRKAKNPKKRLSGDDIRFAVKEKVIIKKERW